MSVYLLSGGAYAFRPLKVGIVGHDVAALQNALNVVVGSSLVVDGSFGAKTESVVKQFQSSRNLVSDGIAGPTTQRELVLRVVYPAQREFDTPPGLMRGIVEGESNFLVGNHTAAYANGTRDVGTCMENVAPTEDNVERALDVKGAVRRLGNVLRNGELSQGKYGKDAYQAMRGISDQDAWFCAILSHNYPKGALHYARLELPFSFRDSDGVIRKSNEPAKWVQAIGISGVVTAEDWCEYYVASKSKYVRSWNY